MRNRHLSSIRLPICLAIAAALVSPVSQAVGINTRNPDLQVNWTTEVRLGLGWRTEGIGAAIGNDPTSHQSDYFAGRGDMWKRRLDLLSEFDFIYKDDFGFRISATGWYDNAYDRRTLRSNPALEGISAYPDNRLSRQAQRFYNGPSGELLDAFVFGSFAAGSTNWSLKAGAHALIWGVSMVDSANSVSWSQQPANLQKAAETPGASPKETAMPLNQFSFVGQLTDTFSVAGYYHLDWKGNRLSEGGTFLGGADFLFSRAGRLYAGTVPGLGDMYIEQGDDLRPRSKRSGNYGLQLTFSPEWYRGNISVVYRRMDETQQGINFSVDPTQLTGVRFHQVYNRDVDLFGVFTNFSWKDYSWGAEISTRRNTALDSTGGPNLAGTLDGATGTTWHGLLNVQGALPRSPLYDTGLFIVEAVHTYLDKVTGNADVYAGCVRATDAGCGTRNATALSLILLPTWTGVWPGVDLNGSLTLASYGLSGNSVVSGGAAKRAYSWSAGVTADINVKYRIGILYSDAGDAEERVGAMGATDRGRLTLTFQTSF